MMTQGQAENLGLEADADSPLPGFPGPPRYKTSHRHSSRLAEKYKGNYSSIEERARKNTKPYATSLARKAMKKRVKAKVIEANLDYFKTLEPLTAAQAEVVLMAAGAGKEGEIDAQTEDVVTLGVG